MWRLAIEQTWSGERIPEDEMVELEVDLRPSGLRLAVDAPWHGDPPPHRPSGFCWGLWEFEVVELFVLLESGRYLELEIGPFGHWLLAELGPEPRRLRSRHEDAEINLRYRREGSRWHAEAVISADLLGGRPIAFGAFAIHGQGDERRFLAMIPSGDDQPDFHISALWRRIVEIDDDSVDRLCG